MSIHNLNFAYLKFFHHHLKKWCQMQQLLLMCHLDRLLIEKIPLQ